MAEAECRTCFDDVPHARQDDEQTREDFHRRKKRLKFGRDFHAATENDRDYTYINPF